MVGQLDDLVQSVQGVRPVLERLADASLDHLNAKCLNVPHILSSFYLIC